MEERLLRIIRHASRCRHGLGWALLGFYLWQLLKHGLLPALGLGRAFGDVLEWLVVPLLATAITAVYSRQHDGELAEHEGLRHEYRQTDQAALQLEAARATALAVTHNLNQPITAIIGYAQLLLDAPPAERDDEEIASIICEAERAAIKMRQLKQIGCYATTSYAGTTPMLDLTAQEPTCALYQ